MSGVMQETVRHLRDFDYEAVCGEVDMTVTYPKRFEIPRGNTGRLIDQGKVMCCLAAVICQIAEEGCRRMTGQAEEMSEGFAYATLRTDYSGKGLFNSQAMQQWLKVGTVPRKYFDRVAEMPEIQAFAQQFPALYEKAKLYCPKGYCGLQYGKQKRDFAVKQALTYYLYGLVAICNTHFGGSPHAVMLVGWNDETGCYKIKNSYGASYGENGFGEVPKDKVDTIYLPLFEEIALPFTDIKKSDWYYDAVRKVYFSGMMQGVSQTAFEAERSITRGEIATILCRLMKEIDLRFDLLQRKAIADSNGRALR